MIHRLYQIYQRIAPGQVLDTSVTLTLVYPTALSPLSPHMKGSTTTQFKKQLPRNALMKGFSFVSALVIGLWLVPYLVRQMGTAAYGLVPLAGLFTQYVGIISNCLALSVTRFLTIELQKDCGRPNVVFNSAIALFTALAVIQAPLFLLAIIYVQNIFSIPIHLLNDAIILLSCSAVSYLFTLIGGVFQVSTFSRNRIDIDEGINLTRIVARIILIVAAFSLLGPALRYIGYIDLMLTVFILCAKVYYWRKLTPELQLSLSDINFKRLHPILGMSGWIIISYLGALLYLRMDIWIANRFISAEAAGQYAALLQWDTLIRSTAGTLGFLTAPMVLIYYSRKEMAQAANLSRLSIKLLTGLLAIPVALIAVCSPQLLRIWLGAEFEHLWPILAIMVSHLFINAGITPAFQLQTATNHVKTPALVTFGMGLINAALALVVVIIFNGGLMGIAIVGAVILTLKNALFTPWYSARITRTPKSSFFSPQLAGLLLAGFTAALGLLTKQLWQPISFASLALLCTIIAIFSLVIFWTFALKRDDKKHLIDLMPG